jgi:hypothetical protein
MSPAQQMLTIWLIDAPAATAAAICYTLRGYYDLSGGFAAIYDARLKGKVPNGRALHDRLVAFQQPLCARCRGAGDQIVEF